MTSQAHPCPLPETSGPGWPGRVKVPRDTQASWGPSPGLHGGHRWHRALSAHSRRRPLHREVARPCAERSSGVSDLCLGRHWDNGFGWAGRLMSLETQLLGGRVSRRPPEEEGERGTPGECVTRPLPNFQALTYSDSPRLPGTDPRTETGIPRGRLGC